MAEIRDTKTFMRVVHRYLGFFLAGIMAIYAITGILLVYRDTDFLKKQQAYYKTVAPNLKDKALGKELTIRDLEITKVSNDTSYFKNGWYIANTGVAHYTKKELPFVLGELVALHKSKSSNPYSALNVFFGVSLFFFVISSFWMFNPKSKIFRKGMIYTIAGLALAVILLFV